MHIEAVLFDLGNVLAFHDDELLLTRLAAHAGRTVEQTRLALAPLWIPCHRGSLADEPLRHEIARALGAPLDEATFYALWNCHFRRHDEVLPLVQALVGRVKLLLLSNTNERHFRYLAGQLPVLKSFDDLVLSYQLGMAKPDPAIYLEALRRAGADPAATAYFDDVPAYVEAAQRLGIQGRVFTDASTFAGQLRELGLG